MEKLATVREIYAAAGTIGEVLRIAARTEPLLIHRDAVRIV